MFALYPLIKVAGPSIAVGTLNLVTYLSFSAYSRSQHNSRNLRIRNQFVTVRKSVFDQIIDGKDELMNKRHVEIVNYLQNKKNQEILKKFGGQKLLSEWEKVAPRNGQAIFQDNNQKSNFFQEVRIFCVDQKTTENKELLIAVSKLCSRKVISEKDFELPKEE
ncbi:hypothetical protein A6V39_04020 [Candidatus Mycoplasma haematobovis]|uniref:Uncharacterized protein n=1 Tax=Candidatus Mycoplasma haematobovis TaxID=432608 RepID=A0A1A9QDM8_9MOLU|nr:hypothetical protein [Candidatus Mycoplasma haematobovis]OAL10055.1 hypothetical protein A6V39_04020 [Candidatus Mycoplasma haematobovis]